MQTPVLKIEGLAVRRRLVERHARPTAARASSGTPRASASATSRLELPDGGPIPPEVQDLLDIIQDNLPINQIVTQIIDLLETVGRHRDPGSRHHRARPHHGQGHRRTRRGERLRAEDHRSTARRTAQDRAPARPRDSRITDGVESGVFRSHDVRPGPPASATSCSSAASAPRPSPARAPTARCRSKNVGAASVPGRGRPDRRQVLVDGQAAAPRARPRASCRPRSATSSIPAGRRRHHRSDLAGRPAEPGPQPGGQAQGDDVGRQDHHRWRRDPTPKPGQSVDFDGGSLVFRKVAEQQLQRHRGPRAGDHPVRGEPGDHAWARRPGASSTADPSVLTWTRTSRRRAVSFDEAARCRRQAASSADS